VFIVGGSCRLAEGIHAVLVGKPEVVEHLEAVGLLVFRRELNPLYEAKRVEAILVFGVGARVKAVVFLRLSSVSKPTQAISDAIVMLRQEPGNGQSGR
jgi:hypothetical protein